MRPQTNWNEMLDEVCARTGLATSADAEPFVRATLEAIAASMHHADAAALACTLPSPAADIVRGGAMAVDVDAAPRLFEHVARRTATALPTALERAEAVCAMLAHRSGEATCAILRRRTPPDVAALFDEPPPASTPPSPPHPRAASRPTLAVGRPGSEHPLSSATPLRPTERVPQKLSTAEAPTAAERRHETLATGRPRSTRPLSGG